MPDTALTPEHIEKLAGAIRNMEHDKVPEDRIKAFVGYYKSKYGTPVATAPPPTPKESFGQQISKDASIGWRSGWSHAANTAANAAKIVGAKETSEGLRKWSQEEAPKEEELVGRDSLIDETVMGATSMAGGLAENAPALLSKRYAPYVGAAIAALGAADKSWKTAAYEGIRAGATFKAMEFAQNAPTRLGRAAGSAVAATVVNAVPAIISGGSAKEVAAAGILGGAMGALTGSPGNKTITEKVPIVKAMKAIILPTKMSADAEGTAINMRKSLGLRERQNEIARTALDLGIRHFERQPINPSNPGGLPDANIDFMSKYQHGNQANIDPKMKPFADLVKEAHHEQYGELNKRNLGQTELENYLGMMYTREGREEPDLFATFSKKPLQGSAFFQKQKAYGNIDEFLDWAKNNPEKAKGVKLLTNNPLELQFFRLREGNKLINAHDFLLSELEQGLMEYVSPATPGRGSVLRGQGWIKPPEGTGKALDGIKIMLAKNGTPAGGDFYMSPDSARIIENLMSKGASGTPFTKGVLYGTGALNKAQLGGSFRHVVVTGLEAAIGQMALTEKYLVTAASQRRPEMALKGIRAAGNIITAPADWLTNAFSHGLRGKPNKTGRFVREYTHPGEFPEMARFARIAATGGGRIGQEAIYRAGDVREIMHKMRGAKQIAQMAWKEHGTLLSLNSKYRGDLLSRMRTVSDITKMTSGLLGIPGAVMEKMTQPIFEYIVPMYKQGAYMRLLEYELDRLKPELNKVGASTPAGEALITKAAQKAWDSVDNRLGTFVYDNLAWNNMFKAGMMVTFRSVGWRLGTIREIGGGLVDWKNALHDLTKGKSPEFTHRMAYTIALPVVTGVVGGMMNYLMTGERPQSLTDMYRPRTGEKDENGRDKRMDIASYINDFAHMLPMMGERYLGRVWRYVEGAVNPGIEVISELARNGDFNNNRIFDREGNPQEQLEDIFKYAIKTILPLSARSLTKVWPLSALKLNTESQYEGKGQEKITPTFDQSVKGPGKLSGFSAGTFVKGMTGISPAPADEMRRPWERFVLENEGHGFDSRDEEGATKSAMRKDLVKALKYNEESEFRRLFDMAVSNGIYKPKDEGPIRKAAKDAPGIYGFKHLGPVDAINAYLYAVKDPEVSTEEKALMRRALTRIIARKMEEYQNKEDGNRAKTRFFNGIKLLSLIDHDGNFQDFTEEASKQ